MDEMNQLKVFTAGEANRLLPELTELITRIQAHQEEILTKEVEIDALEMVHPAAGEGKPAPEVEREVDVYNQCISQFYSMIDQVHELGCHLKDVETGLVDFYTVHEGRVVYLCWKLGEKEVGHWHEIGRGFAYRQPIIREDEKESSG